ncbi:hypothetical protein ACFL34_03675 [Candidatus Sumerlaeota bacterium]
MVTVTDFRTLVGLIVLVAIAAAAPLPAAEVKIVVAEGRSAAKDLGRAFDEAKDDALREAVNQAAGVWVDSDTLTKNYKLVADLVQTKSKGFVRTYEVISKGKEDDFYVVKISAEIIMTQLKLDLQAIGLLRQVTGGQRIMVVGVEKVDGIKRDSHYAQQPLEAALLAKGFDLVDKDQIEAMKARDVAINFEDFSQAATLGKRLNAEIVVLYSADASYGGQENLYGNIFHRYEVNITAKIIKVDTGRVRKSVVDRGTYGAASRGNAANTALQKASAKAGPKIVKGIIAALEREFKGEGADLEIYVKNIDFKNHMRLKKELGKLRFVKSVGSAKFAKGVGIYRIKAIMQGDQLAEKLYDLEGFDLQVESVEQNRIDCVWGSGE